ncbi:prepilin-type N-terminal cleavage/methylation domain-containing protein [Candidatus Sumerlaeota bacterium]|nr:prepilin-type N-terminal cleavage/methylation domain-containing protein [Candidatus Sumerlaeota bacterium]
MVRHHIPTAAFTLIELLVAVLIIAILSAIAVPNFLEAQTRSKVSRTRADHRTLAVGLEAYAADHNRYPLNNQDYNVPPVELSTPIAYMTSSYLVDPFSDKERHAFYGELARLYTYTMICEPGDIARFTAVGHTPPPEAVDGGGYNPGARRRYGDWRLVGNGPDRKYSFTPGLVDAFNPNPPALRQADIPYDPTNGSASYGNILRCQKYVDPVGYKF